MNNFGGKITLGEATKIVYDYDEMSKEVFERTVAAGWKQENIDTTKLTPYDLEVRSKLIAAYNKSYREILSGNSNMYLLDLNVGLTVYELLEPEKTEFTIADATDDDMWRYITFKIIPDLTLMRYPAKNEQGAKNINKQRFFSNSRRIWIKSLWWYVYLSWQGSREKTYEVLKNNAIDNINKLIETPGKGYRLSVYRAMMREYAKRNHSTKYFAGVTQLNNVKCRNVEPELTKGGEYAYVIKLFEEVPHLSEKEESDAEE